MRHSNWKVIGSALIGAALAAPALAGVTITQSAAPAPTYATTLNFDEPGGPVGAGLPANSWQAGWGVSIGAGDGNQVVADSTGIPGYSWLGTGNSFYGNYGVFMNFDTPVTEFSAQFWDPSGPPSFFGGGAMAFVYAPDAVDDNAYLDFFSFTPAWGGVGDTCLTITTDGGTVIDDIRILGYGNFPTSYMDNASWNSVPAPGAAALLGLAGLAGARRRRA